MLIGVVGKANVGKSTLFKAMTLADVEIANYPFATIEPNEGVGHVRVDCAETFFKVKCNPRVGYCEEGQRFVPVKLIDVAGLVPGAHEGKGMGNQFLDDLRQADVLIHVVDCAGTTNENGEVVVAGSYDPVQDVRFLEEELDHWYHRILKKGWERFARKVVQEKREIKKEIGEQLSGLGVNEYMADDVIRKLNLKEIQPTKWTDQNLFDIATELRKKTKPMVIACNKIDMATGKANFERLKQEFPDRILIACSAESELALKEAAKNGLIDYVPGDSDFKIIDKSKINEKQKQALKFIKKNVLDEFGSAGVQEAVNRAVFELLGYIAVFPIATSKLGDKEGNVLPDCYLVPPKSTALDFAYFVHTDIGDKFIRAIDVKTKVTVGKDHLLKHGDVVEIVSGR